LTATLAYLWASPVSVPAAALALLARAGGGRIAFRDGVLEASGGLLAPLLRRGYPPLSIAAITLGHVVLAQSVADLERTRIHERAHVRQFERWGPIFPALYLGASLVARMRGGDAYRDNRFEVEARAEEGRLASR
jgi:hypothetical protein